MMSFRLAARRSAPLLGAAGRRLPAGSAARCAGRIPCRLLDNSSLARTASTRLSPQEAEPAYVRQPNGINDDPHSLDDLCCDAHMMIDPERFARGCTFLHMAALGNLDEIRSMLASNPDLVNFRDYDRRSALHLAASEGHVGVCELLVGNGARINRSDRWGNSPLNDAHRHRHADVLEYLRSCGGAFGSPSQASNFIAAACEGDADEVRALLEYGNVDIDGGDYDGRTALHLAAGEGRLEVVEILCDAGAEVNVKDRWSSTPWDDAKAAKTNSAECVDLLEHYGAKSGSTEICSTKEALLDVMQQYGKVRDGELTMDWHDVSDLLRGIGEEPTEELVKKLFEVADTDHDGLIGTDEFLNNSDAFLGERPARIILVVGGPGSGKGLLCERLVRECGVVHLSSGDLLRDEVSRGTALGRQVEEIMKGGGLVSSAIMVTLMKKRMKDHPGKRILLDGFPRSAENARDLVTLCGRPELALHLDCDDTVLLERIMSRGRSGARADDNFHTAIQRVRNYHKYHHITLDFLREEHVPIVYLDCSATPDVVWEQLRAVGRLMRSTVRLPTEQKKNNGNGNNSSSFDIPSC